MTSLKAFTRQWRQTKDYPVVFSCPGNTPPRRLFAGTPCKHLVYDSGQSGQRSSDHETNLRTLAPRADRSLSNIADESSYPLPVQRIRETEYPHMKKGGWTTPLLPNDAI